MNLSTTRPDAEYVAFSLPKARRTGPDKYLACCPAHDDKSPSFAVSQKGDQVLFYCFAGCSQGEVIDALRGRGLWPEPKQAAVHSLVDKDELRAYCQAHETNLKRSIPTATKSQRLYRQYQRVLYSPFTPAEVAQMHLYCLVYSAAVKRGETPTEAEDKQFRAYSTVVCEKGIPHAWW